MGRSALGTLSSRTGSVGSPVRYQVPASDGLSGCTLRFSATGLPPGLAISSCGMISGWLATGGHYTVHVQVDGYVRHGSGDGLVRLDGRSGRRASAGLPGTLWLSRDGKCLAALSATSIVIETCSSAANQHWAIAADGTLHVNGSCLAAKATSSSSPAALELTSCTTGQRWQLGSRAVLTNLGDGRCLADTGTNNGSLATAAVCVATPNNTGSSSTPSPSQQWIPACRAADLRDSRQLREQRAIHRVSRWAPSRSGRATGRARRLGPSSRAAQLSLGGQCLGLTAGATTPGTRVRLGPCSTAPSQVWQVAGGPIGVRIVSPLGAVLPIQATQGAGLCLADPGDSTTGGTQLVIDPCVAGDPGILWRVT